MLIALDMSKKKPEPPFDPNPRPLLKDPILGTREKWEWCPRCCGIREPNHTCWHPEPNQ